MTIEPRPEKKCEHKEYEEVLHPKEHVFCYLWLFL